MSLEDSDPVTLRSRHTFRVIDELERVQSPRHFDLFLIRDLTKRGWKPGYHLFWNPDTLEIEVIKDDETYERTIEFYAKAVVQAFGDKIYVKQDQLEELKFYAEYLEGRIDLLRMKQIDLDFAR